MLGSWLSRAISATKKHQQWPWLSIGEQQAGNQQRREFYINEPPDDKSQQPVEWWTIGGDIPTGEFYMDTNP